MAGIGGQTLSMVLLCVLEYLRPGDGGLPGAETLFGLSPLMLIPAFAAMAAAP